MLRDGPIPIIQRVENGTIEDFGGTPALVGDVD
ncbi:hypothetical protein GGE65_008288 [Skermanella aerolata]